MRRSRPLRRASKDVSVVVAIADIVVDVVDVAFVVGVANDAVSAICMMLMMIVMLRIFTKITNSYNVHLSASFPSQDVYEACQSRCS